MRKIRRILFPIDLSPQCVGIIPHVKAMASSFDAEVVALNVLEAPSGYYKDWNAYLTLVNWNAIKEDHERRVTQFIKTEFHRKPVHQLIEEGDAAHLIVKCARENAIDLIMMPTHGYGTFRGLLIGSVTAKVLHDVEIPVWTSAHSPEPTPHTSYRRILCATDATEKNIPAMKWAASFARHFKADFHLVHAIPGAETVDLSFQSFLFASAKNEIAKLQQAAGINAESCVAAGSVGDVIREAVVQHKDDLVVVGRGHLTETLGRLRTNVYCVIRQSPCPVISV